jgi:hypothetical protein
MIVYVERDQSGAVSGVYLNAQPGRAEEPIDDADPEVVAYRNPPAPPFDLTRYEALATLLTRGDVTAVQVRLVVAVVTFLINNRLEEISTQLATLGAPGLAVPRVLEPEILGFAAANPTLGDPAPPS